MKGDSEKQTSRTWKTAVCQKRTIVILIVCVVLAIAVGLILTFVLSGKLIFVEKERNFRLPTNLLPTYYALEVKPYLIPDSFKFEGKVEIKIKCEEETDEIVLHSSGLELDEEKVTVRRVRGDRLNVLRVRFDEGNQFLVLQLLEVLKQNETYLVSFSYKGNIGEDGTGFFVSIHEDSEGITHYAASTIFESFKARTAFPCFDEPAMKANFDITIVRWKNMTSLSNMKKIKNEPRGGDWVADLFQTTPKMSTYLVAFFVGDYVGRTSGLVSIWSSPDEANHTKLALETSLKFLKFYKERLPPYALPKLDMVPVDKLSSKAIENWGMIVYSRKYLLYDENVADDIIVKQAITEIIGHEIAHQWFGNLVTPKWWSDIWLSEGIAAYMEQTASRALFPLWYQIDKTTTTLYDSLIEMDCMNYGTVHKSINKDTSDSNIFDIFVYLKGAAILRMAHGILEPTFWKGLSNYLEKYAYGVAEEKDLWECLSKVQHVGSTPKVNLTEIMTLWTHRPGIPIVNVERDYDRGTVTFIQMPCIEGTTGEKVLWHVPITLTTAEDRQWNPSVLMWLTSRNATIKNLPNEKQWIVVNGKNTGYYIVNYDLTNWNLLAHELRQHHERFPLEYRFKILADAVLLEKLGHMNMDTVMDISLFIAKENRLSILTKHIMQIVSRTRILIQESNYFNYWKEYMVYLFENAYKILHRPGANTDVEAPLPGYISSILCFSNYAPCINKARKEFQDWKEGIENGTEDLRNKRRLVELYHKFCFAIQHGNDSDWEFIYSAYEMTRIPQFLDPLVCSTNRVLIKRLLRVIFEYNQGRGINAVYVLSSLTHWAEILIYLRDHFDEISSNDHLFEGMLTILRSMQGPAKYEQVLATFKKFLRKLSGSKKEELKKVLDDMQKQLPLLESQRYTVESWLGRRPWA